MAGSNSVMIHKLQQALNSKGYKILYQQAQFYSNDQDRPVTIHTIKQAVWNKDKQKNTDMVLFSSASQIQIVKFLRDMWNEVREGKEVELDEGTDKYTTGNN